MGSFRVATLLLCARAPVRRRSTCVVYFLLYLSSRTVVLQAGGGGGGSEKLRALAFAPALALFLTLELLAGRGGDGREEVRDAGDSTWSERTDRRGRGCGRRAGPASAPGRDPGCCGFGSAGGGPASTSPAPSRGWWLFRGAVAAEYSTPECAARGADTDARRGL